MISAFRLLHAIGQFVHVDAGATLALDKLTLVFSENGRGKTTLAAVLRSVANGDPTPILERTRLTGTELPQAVVEFDQGQIAAFQGGAWTVQHPEVVVFDDEFVDQNIYSGLGVDPEHRQHLHELIIGTQAVVVNRELGELVAQVETHNATLRRLAAAVPEMARPGLTVDAFCALPVVPDVDDKIASTERDLAAARAAEEVLRRPLLATLDLTPFDLDRIREVLADNLGVGHNAVTGRVREHLAVLGDGGERWVEEGMRRMGRSGHDDACPFCAQDLAGSSVVEPYRTLFSDGYKDLTQRLSAFLVGLDSRHGGDAIASFERAVRELAEAHAFWRPIVEAPVMTLDTGYLAALRTNARDAVRVALEQKQQSPLDRIELGMEAVEVIEQYNEALEHVERVNDSIRVTNLGIAVAKERVGSSNASELAASLGRYEAIRLRHQPEMAAACGAYLAEVHAKRETERHRNETRQQLDTLRTAVFPGYQESTNYYLQRLNAGFRLGDVTPINTRGGPSVTYNVLIDDVAIAVQGDRAVGEPSFRTALSAGDRTTLALAFFLALLEHSQTLATDVVVVDDPVSSMDEQRSWATVQELRTLAGRVAQLIVLSHNKVFLCNLWDASNRTDRASLEIVRAAQGSDLSEWDVRRDTIGEHDRRDQRFLDYLDRAQGERRNIAKDLRPHLEAYLRVAYPANFPPGSLIGPFLALCRARASTVNELLDNADIAELDELLEFSNRFHHDSNALADNEQVTDAELQGMVRRVRGFVQR